MLEINAHKYMYLCTGEVITLAWNLLSVFSGWPALDNNNFVQSRFHYNRMISCSNMPDPISSAPAGNTLSSIVVVV